MANMTNKPLHRAQPAQGRDIVRRAFAIVVLAATVTAFAGCSPKSDDKSDASATPSNVTLTADQRQHIRLYTVSPSRFYKTLETSGAVDFDNDQATSVLAPFSGPVSRLLVSPGDRVKKGQPLAVVDSPDFAAAISTYRKALVTAQTDRRLADMDKDLVEHQGVARREEDQAQTDAASAEADSEAARQALVALGVDPQTIRAARRGRAVSRVEGIIRSPITGTVVEKLITPGELLQAGATPCFTVADLSRVWVLAQIFDADVASVAVGDPADVETDSRTLSGTVENISALVDPDTRSVVARVALANPGDALKKQMYVRVSIKSREESSGTLVPVSAILRDDENLPFVYVAQANGSFARQHVTLGYRAGDQYDISDGPKPGSRIVVDGGLFIQFMQNQ
jgi:membrane fusion protein, heavy metal efflux system